MKGWEKIFHAHNNCERAEEVILILNKIYFKTEVVVLWHVMLIKGSIHKEDITIVNINTKQLSHKTYEASIKRIKGSNRWFYSNIWRRQYLH